MSDNKWTPEPWNEFRFRAFNGSIILRKSDYERARECVNALAGEKDPAHFVKLKLDYEKELFDIRYLLKVSHEKTTLEAVNEMLKQRDELAESVKRLSDIIQNHLNV